MESLNSILLVSSAVITYLVLKLVQGFMAVQAMKAIVLLFPISYISDE